MAEYTYDTVIPAAPGLVFEILADKEKWSRLIAIPTSLERPGTDERQGVGAVHRIGTRLLGGSEEVLVYEPSRRYEYKLVSRAPVRRHYGTITFDETPTGTRVRYRIEVVPVVPTPARLTAAVLRGSLSVLFRAVRGEVGRRSISSASRP